jgi:hypothetical protein
MPTKKSSPIKKVVAVVKKKDSPALRQAGVKKVIPKAVSIKVKKSGEKKPMVVASGEMCFWVNDGAALSSMKDLSDALRTMSKEQFIHHTGMGRNDFSAWVKDVLGDKKCSADLMKAKNMKAALSAVEKHLKEYRF